MLFLLKLAFDREVLPGYVAFLVLVLSTKKSLLQFFSEFFFKFKVLKTLNISSNCHLKTLRFLKHSAILTIRCTFFKIVYSLAVGLKTKPIRRSFFLC